MTPVEVDDVLTLMALCNDGTPLKQTRRARWTATSSFRPPCNELLQDQVTCQLSIDGKSLPHEMLFRGSSLPNNASLLPQILPGAALSKSLRLNEGGNYFPKSNGNACVHLHKNVRVKQRE
ncbi:hypothetical protein TcWFU_007590 [Taenia crassiceps]|uniref:Uncharacterized protein n=1 Tax=Taenia crassiceps TaxID=6207 RepID=A0ABR4Q9F5_9CEST